MDSSQLSRTLIEARLVEEYHLMPNRCWLAGGKTVFAPDGAKQPLEFLGTTAAGSGVLSFLYRSSRTPQMPDWER